MKYSASEKETYWKGINGVSYKFGLSYGCLYSVDFSWFFAFLMIFVIYDDICYFLMIFDISEYGGGITDSIWFSLIYLEVFDFRTFDQTTLMSTPSDICIFSLSGILSTKTLRTKTNLHMCLTFQFFLLGKVCMLWFLCSCWFIFGVRKFDRFSKAPCGVHLVSFCNPLLPSSALGLTLYFIFRRYFKGGWWEQIGWWRQINLWRI